MIMAFFIGLSLVIAAILVPTGPIYYVEMEHEERMKELEIQLEREKVARILVEKGRKIL